MKGFTEAETNLIIEEAKISKERGESLICCFKRIAAKLNRADGSVRNYYYSLFKSDENKILQDKIKSANLKAEKIINFSTAEEEVLLTQILEGVKSGKSVRAAIAQLSQGDEKRALRMQNKYRNIVKRNPRLFERISDKVFGEGNYQKTKRYEPTKEQIESVTLAINRLIDRLTDKYKRENERLKQRIKSLDEKIELISPSDLVSDYFRKSKKKNKLLN